MKCSIVGCKEITFITSANIFDINYNEINDIIENPKTGFTSKDNLPLFNTFIYPDNKETYHKFQSSIGFNTLMIDFDKNVSIVEAEERFKDYQYFLYTSFGHQLPDKNDGQLYDKFRIILPLDNEYSIKFLTDKLRKSFLLDHKLFEGCDKSTLDLRGFFMPAINPDKNYKYYSCTNAGIILNIGNLFDNSWKFYKAANTIEPNFGRLQDFGLNKDNFGQNLMAKYKRTITHNCQNRNTGVHAMMCTVASGLKHAKVSPKEIEIFMIELFNAKTNSDKSEITNIIRGLK